MLYRQNEFNIFKEDLDDRVVLLAEASSLSLPVGEVPPAAIAIISEKTNQGVRFVMTETVKAGSEIAAWNYVAPNFPNLSAIIFND